MVASEYPLSAGTGDYPVRGNVASDRRFELLARDVGRVLSDHGYPRVNGDDRDELESLLADFIYGAQVAQLKEAAS